MFRELTPAEIVEFERWARENYTPGEPINPLWHPVVQAECERMLYLPDDPIPLPSLKYYNERKA